MTAPEPRMDEIQARLSAADATDIEWSSLPALTDDDVIMFRVYDDEGHAIAECSDMAVASLAGHAPADLAYLLAELRKAREALADLLYVADHKAADNQIGRWWAEVIRGPIIQHLGEDGAARLRAAVAAAKGSS